MGKKNALLKRLHVAVLFSILIFIQIGYIAGAEEQFGISLDCVDSCNGKNDMDYSKPEQIDFSPLHPSTVPSQ